MIGGAGPWTIPLNSSPSTPISPTAQPIIQKPRKIRMNQFFRDGRETSKLPEGYEMRAWLDMVAETIIAFIMHANSPFVASG